MQVTYLKSQFVGKYGVISDNFYFALGVGVIDALLAIDEEKAERAAPLYNQLKDITSRLDDALEELAKKEEDEEKGVGAIIKQMKNTRNARQALS